MSADEFADDFVVLSVGSKRDEDPKSFFDVHRRLGKVKLNPFKIKVSNNDTLQLLGRRVPSNEVSLAIAAIHKNLRCNTCKDFLSKKALLVGSDGRGPLSKEVVVGHPEYQELYKAIEKCPVEDVELVGTGKQGVPTAGGFRHFSFDTVISCMSSKVLAADYQWFFKQHTETMIRLLGEQDQDGILQSLDVLIEVLPEVPYGDKLVHSARWFKKAMQSWQARKRQPDYKRRLVAMEALCAAPLSPGHGQSERVICTNLSQFKENTLGAMEVAHNRSALKRLLSERLSPHNYCRPTVEATLGQLEEATRMFKDLGFHTWLMPLENLAKYGGKIGVASHQSQDASSIWEGVLRKKRTNFASGLASRCSGEVSTPTGLRMLLENFDRYPGIEVQTSGMTPVMVSEYPESARKAIKYPFLWGFCNGTKISAHKTKFAIRSGFCKVTGMIALGERSMFLAVEGARLPRDLKHLGNTCFPAFLEPSYQRKCRRAFEQLNENPMGLPEGADRVTTKFALGVGTSAIDEGQNLYGSVAFRFKDKTFTLTKM